MFLLAFCVSVHLNIYRAPTNSISCKSVSSLRSGPYRRWAGCLHLLLIRDSSSSLISDCPSVQWYPSIPLHALHLSFELNDIYVFLPLSLCVIQASWKWIYHLSLSHYILSAFGHSVSFWMLKCLRCISCMFLCIYFRFSQCCLKEEWRWLCNIDNATYGNLFKFRQNSRSECFITPSQWRILSF